MNFLQRKIRFPLSGGKKIPAAKETGYPFTAVTVPLAIAKDRTEAAAEHPRFLRPLGFIPQNELKKEETAWPEPCRFCENTIILSYNPWPFLQEFLVPLLSAGQQKKTRQLNCVRAVRLLRSDRKRSDAALTGRYRPVRIRRAVLRLLSGAGRVRGIRLLHWLSSGSGAASGCQQAKRQDQNCDQHFSFHSAPLFSPLPVPDKRQTSHHSPFF